MADSRKWANRSCLILGTDGYDPCVTLNLLLFYTSLGFDVFISQTPRPADLIVLTRFNFGKDGCPPDYFSAIPKDTPIHIYSYVGWSPNILRAGLQKFPVSLFAPSTQLLADNVSWLQNIILPPVFSQFWARTAPERPFEVAHIGNYKARNEHEGGWREEQYLLAAVRNPRVHIWGTHGWENVPGVANLHGELPIFGVPEVYARTKFALGLMYPFQIETQTFSSRFWQAPLGGAKLFCEEGVKQVFPGVYPVGIDNWEAKLTWFQEPNEVVQRRAIQFWDEKLRETATAVVGSLLHFPPRSTGYIPEEMQSLEMERALEEGILMKEYVYRSGAPSNGLETVEAR